MSTNHVPCKHALADQTAAAAAAAAAVEVEVEEEAHPPVAPLSSCFSASEMFKLSSCAQTLSNQWHTGITRCGRPNRCTARALLGIRGRDFTCPIHTHCTRSSHSGTKPCMWRVQAKQRGA
jgi:hypothetical protein